MLVREAFDAKESSLNLSDKMKMEKKGGLVPTYHRSPQLQSFPPRLRLNIRYEKTNNLKMK